jgi:hypothetical protein
VEQFVPEKLAAPLTNVDDDEPSSFLEVLYEGLDLSGEDGWLWIFAGVDLFDIDDTTCEEGWSTEGLSPRETCVVIDGLDGVDERFPFVITVDEVCVIILFAWVICRLAAVCDDVICLTLITACEYDTP